MIRKSLAFLFTLSILQSSIALAQLQLLTPYSGSTCAGSTFANAINASGVLTCATPSVSSVVLNNIAAATGSNTIANGNNTGQVWNWANTTNTTVAFTVGETSAATNGTSTSGIPNQVLLKLNTVANSTQSPFSVYSRGAHVFSVSPTAKQILGYDGDQTNPMYGFASSTNTGLYGGVAGTGWGLAAAGNVTLSSQGTSQLISFIQHRFNAGTAAAPSPSIAGTTYGFFLSTDLGVATNSIENSRWTSGGIYQLSKGSADAVAYSINSRKSRGTVASPTLITTGDDLLTLSGFGYVGGTNTYREAARITFDSTGTISDATNGIGANIEFSTQKQGTDTSPAVRARVDQNGHLVSIAGTANTPTMGACGTLPSVAGTDNAMSVTVGTGGAATSCAVSFGSTWAGNTPVCVAQNDTDIVAYKVSTTTTGVTVTASAAFTASSKFQVLCIGQQ